MKYRTHVNGLVPQIFNEPNLVSLVAQMVKNLPAMQDTRVRFLRWEDPLEKGKLTYSGILALRIPCTEESWATVQGVTKSQTQLSD